MTLFLGMWRQEGKTDALLQWASRSPDRAVIVMNEQERKRILRANRGLWSPVQVVTVTDIKNGYNLCDEYAVDNVDLILPQLLAIREPIVAATYTIP